MAYGNLTFTFWANTTIGGEDYAAGQLGNGVTLIIHKTMLDNGSSFVDAYELLIYTAQTLPYNLANWTEDTDGAFFTALTGDFENWINA